MSNTSSNKTNMSNTKNNRKLQLQCYNSFDNKQKFDKVVKNVNYSDKVSEMFEPLQYYNEFTVHYTNKNGEKCSSSVELHGLYNELYYGDGEEAVWNELTNELEDCIDITLNCWLKFETKTYVDGVNVGSVKKGLIYIDGEDQEDFDEDEKEDRLIIDDLRILGVHLVKSK